MYLVWFVGDFAASSFIEEIPGSENTRLHTKPGSLLQGQPLNIAGLAPANVREHAAFGEHGLTLGGQRPDTSHCTVRHGGDCGVGDTTHVAEDQPGRGID